MPEIGAPILPSSVAGGGVAVERWVVLGVLCWWLVAVVGCGCSAQSF